MGCGMTSGLADDAVAELVDQLTVLVRGGDSVERAVNRLRGGGVPDQMIGEARRIYEVRVGLIRELDDPLALVEREYRTGGWYTGPKEDDPFWWPMRRKL